jgi:hypothetical protein
LFEQENPIRSGDEIMTNGIDHPHDTASPKSKPAPKTAEPSKEKPKPTQAKPVEK